AAGTAYPGTFTIGLSSWIGYAPLFVALEKGFFEKNGLTVAIQKIESGSDRRSAIAANRIQGMASTVDAVVIAVANGIPITQVLALDMSNGGDGLVAKKEYNSLEDLKGKTVALDTSGVASYFWFHVLLKQRGLTIDQFDVQSMGAGDAGAAFVAGRVDAALTWQPWLTRASETSFGKVLISSSETPGVITDSLSIRKDIIEKYPDAVQAIVNGWMEAVEYAKTSPTEANEIMAKAMGQTVDEFVATLPDVLFYDKKDNISYLGSSSKPGEINEILTMASDLWSSMGEIPTKPDIASLVNYTFVNK
ncbi:MAG: ABC transporter substrate-binding protein, partial [Spirochaetaceae bacterium]|nr:ABC transporter substrate-binding protein [Spirochaetaceae bacterium]